MFCTSVEVATPPPLLGTGTGFAKVRLKLLGLCDVADRNHDLGRKPGFRIAHQTAIGLHPDPFLRIGQALRSIGLEKEAHALIVEAAVGKGV